MRLSNNIISYDWSNSTTEKKMNSPTWAWETAAMAVVEKNNSGNSFSQQDHPRHRSGCLTLASSSSSEFVSRFLLLLHAAAASHATRYANKKRNQFFSFHYMCLALESMLLMLVEFETPCDDFFLPRSRGIYKTERAWITLCGHGDIGQFECDLRKCSNSLCSHVAFFTNFSALSAPIVVRRDANFSSSETSASAVAERQNKKELKNNKVQLLAQWQLIIEKSCVLQMKLNWGQTVFVAQIREARARSDQRAFSRAHQKRNPTLSRPDLTDIYFASLNTLIKLVPHFWSQIAHD